jgi:purine nucleosidase
MKRILFLLIVVLFPVLTEAQNDLGKPRYRVILDNDFGGDPDGLIQLAHQLLSSSTEIKAIIGSAHDPMGFSQGNRTGSAVEEINKLLSVMGLEGRYAVYEGSNEEMNVNTPADSKGARAIIAEAMRTDTKLPLYVLCGASLTTVASAYLIEPAIADKLTIIWIGGQGYNDMTSNPEYNLNISIPAAQVIFNKSTFPLWQVTRDAYRQAIMSVAEMTMKVAAQGELGSYLTDKITGIMAQLSPYGFNAETYVLGDSPLVLLSALQAYFDPEPSSCRYILRNAPVVSDNGLYKENPNGRQIRVYTDIDSRLMFDDFVAKLTLFNNGK